MSWPCQCSGGQGLPSECSLPMFKLLIDFFLCVRSDNSQVLRWPCHVKGTLSISPQVHRVLILYFNGGRFLLVPSTYHPLLVPLPNLFSPYGLACRPPCPRNACSLGWWGRGCGKVGIQGAERREGPAAPLGEWEPPRGCHSIERHCTLELSWAGKKELQISFLFLT